MKRSAPLKPGKPLRRSGKRLRLGRSTGTPTKAEAARIVEAKFGPCVPCVVWAMCGHMPIEHVMQSGDYDHKKSGNVRRGHAFGFCSCKWHHMGYPGEGWTHAQMRDKFGPSLMDGSRLFHTTYGSDDELIALQSRVLGGGA